MTADTDSPARAKKTAEESLGRHLSMRADQYAHKNCEPLYDLGDELFDGAGVDVEHVFDFYARTEETHAMLFSDLEALVDTDPATFEALDEANRAVVSLAMVARGIHRGDLDGLRDDVDRARWALDQAHEFLDDLEDELALDADQ